MAKKRKRRRKALPPIDPDKKRSRTPRDDIDGMPCPNHNIPLVLPETMGKAGPHDVAYPMMHLQTSEEGSGSANGLAFVDPAHGIIRWVDRKVNDEPPPTWMDPEVFIHQLYGDDDGTVNEALNKVVAKDPKKPRAVKTELDPKDVAALEQVIDRYFEEKYLVYLFQRFEEARPLLARWMIAARARELMELYP